ncbi:MAG: response regulator [Candidatus Omnitrophica bacterium]|jgi:CheY-like chemotaxis protein|nr:response regulator [Candidatus Omnitrophota bacterium]
MGKKILIVDDEPDLLRVVCFRLEKIGYQVISAVNGQEALELAEKESPDLMLLDVRLPLLGGPEVCSRIKKDERLKHIPVILFTASTQSITEKVQACGAQGYILKPFSSEELFKKIKEFIS